MANYHDWHTFVAKDPNEIGLGFGDDKETGQQYFCIAGLREKIETETHAESDWVSVTPECILELYQLLASNKDRFDTEENRQKLELKRLASYNKE